VLEQILLEQVLVQNLLEHEHVLEHVLVLEQSLLEHEQILLEHVLETLLEHEHVLEQSPITLLTRTQKFHNHRRGSEISVNLLEHVLEETLLEHVLKQNLLEQTLFEHMLKQTLLEHMLEQTQHSVHYVPTCGCKCVTARDKVCARVSE